MEGNFLGLGFKNLIGVAIFVIIAIVVLKVVLTKHPVKGATEIMQTV